MPVYLTVVTVNAHPSVSLCMTYVKCSKFMCVFVWVLARVELLSLSPSYSSPDVQPPQSYDASALLHFSIKHAGMKKEQV